MRSGDLRAPTTHSWTYTHNQIVCGAHNRFADHQCSDRIGDHHPASGTLRQPRDTELRLLVERLAGLPRHLKHALLYGSATTALLPQRHIHAGCKLLHVDGATAGGRGHGRSTTPSAAAETRAGAAARAVARDRRAPRLARRLAGRGAVAAATDGDSAPRAAAVARRRAVRDAAAAADAAAHAADRGAARPAADAAAAAGPDDL